MIAGPLTGFATDLPENGAAFPGIAGFDKPDVAIANPPTAVRSRPLSRRAEPRPGSLGANTPIRVVAEALPIPADNGRAMDRAAAVGRVEHLVETVETDPMPVPVREVWVFGDLALGLDPVDRLRVYLTKDILLRDDDPDADDLFETEYGVSGVGRTVRSEWARRNPDLIRTNDAGHVAPERCLAAHLTDPDEPIHLEVCNSGFEDNVTQRLAAARETAEYERLLDPRGVCLWVDGERSETALSKLRAGDLVLPTLPSALEMLGMDPDEAESAAERLRAYQRDQTGATVRGDVV